MSKKDVMLEALRVQKFVHGGQCLADAPDGKKLFVWGGLPGELVNVRITKKKNSYLEGVVHTVLESSPDRITPQEPTVYLSSSPWQCMSFNAENRAKQAILEETFMREGIQDHDWQAFYSGNQEYGYRNKLEIGFWGDDEGIRYASYVRGSHQKQIIETNALAQDALNNVLSAFLESLNTYCTKNHLRAGDFKTVVFRCTKNGSVAAALYCKKELDFSSFIKPESLQGIVFYYSNPKSPASVPTKRLHLIGDIKLTDALLGKNITYDVLSFFQVNIPVFGRALTEIKEQVSNFTVVDMYAGVGSIGLTVGATTLVESDEHNVRMAKENAQGLQDVEVVQASSEDALEHIAGNSALIVDPPRAGLHARVVEKIVESKPPKVVYLSCNPITQARDVKILLSAGYAVSLARGYNFFPRTPHIESLIVLERV